MSSPTGAARTRTALIIGAGPAGLTAALELLRRTDVLPVVIERTAATGGLSRTVEYRGNRMDIGGHRFFSKSDRVIDWWLELFPLQGAPASDQRQLNITYHRQSRPLERPEGGPDPETTDRVMLVRDRRSRIYYLRQLFDYPLTVNFQSLVRLGPVRFWRILISYLHARLFPVRPERSLRDFLINRFGRELYFTFFRSYTQKVWGVPCKFIRAEWGAQRIKGLSLFKAVLHLSTGWLRRRDELAQKKVETSLIERFLYPKYGPGQIWEEAARQVRELGGRIRYEHELAGLRESSGRITAASVRDLKTGRVETLSPDFVFSSAPVKELIEAFETRVPDDAADVARRLVYRDFISIGVLLRRMRLQEKGPDGRTGLPRDNWIYIQERDVKVGRMQIFNNWSPYLVRDPSQTVWVGMEYFCNEGDDLWRLDDARLSALAAAELVKLELADPQDILDSTVVKMPKAYPAYVGSAYERFDRIRRFTDGIENLFLVGRNGMHRYNNQDHSMLTAMTAVDNLAAGIRTKDNLWAVNTEMDYQEERDSRSPRK